MQQETKNYYKLVIHEYTFVSPCLKIIMFYYIHWTRNYSLVFLYVKQKQIDRIKLKYFSLLDCRAVRNAMLNFCINRLDKRYYT